MSLRDKKIEFPSPDDRSSRLQSACLLLAIDASKYRRGKSLISVKECASSTRRLDFVVDKDVTARFELTAIKEEKSSRRKHFE